jgi:hypothetical protein
VGQKVQQIRESISDARGVSCGSWSSCGVRDHHLWEPKGVRARVTRTDELRRSTERKSVRNIRCARKTDEPEGTGRVLRSPTPSGVGKSHAFSLSQLDFPQKLPETYQQEEIPAKCAEDEGMDKAGIAKWLKGRARKDVWS